MMTAVQEQYGKKRSEAKHVAIASLHKASKNFGDVHALREVDFSVRAGELVALLGPNGAGKTTAVKLFLGLAKPTAGSVNVFGGNPIEPEVRMRIGAMLQVAKVPETLRVREHIDLFSSYYPKPLPLAETLALGDCKRSKTECSANFQAGKNSACYLLWLCAATPTFCFSMSPQSVWMWNLGGCCGTKFAS